MLALLVKRLLFFVRICYNCVSIGEIMLNNNSKYPKFFIYMLLSLAVMNFASAFINAYIVAATFFISIIVLVVFMMLDRKYGAEFSNYKVTFFLLDLICIIAIITIMVYEFQRANIVLKVSLALVVVMLVLSMISEWFLLKNENFTNNENMLVNATKLCSMICLLTYFFNISNLFFALDSLIFEVAAFTLKIYLNYESDEKKKEPVVKTELSIEERIFSAGESEGEFE